MCVASVSRMDLLSKNNYDTWKMQMEALLINYDAWDYANGVYVKATAETSQIRNNFEYLPIGIEASCYATFDRGLAQAEKVGVRGVGSIKFICVPGEHSAFIKKKQKKKNDSEQNENKIT
jgi:hypothetical protein